MFNININVCNFHTRCLVIMCQERAVLNFKEHFYKTNSWPLLSQL
jgi:hypothetical protein